MYSYNAKCHTFSICYDVILADITRQFLSQWQKWEHVENNWKIIVK